MRYAEAAVVLGIGVVAMAFWWSKPEDARPSRPASMSQPAEEHLVIGDEPAPVAVFTVANGKRLTDAPEFARVYTFEFAWGRFQATRHSRSNYRGGLERRWDSYADLTERGRQRAVWVDCDKPIADQILRPEIAADVERAIPQILAADALPLPDTFTDQAGQKWQRVR